MRRASWFYLKQSCHAGRPGVLLADFQVNTGLVNALRANEHNVYGQKRSTMVQTE